LIKPPHVSKGFAGAKNRTKQHLSHEIRTAKNVVENALRGLRSYKETPAEKLYANEPPDNAELKKKKLLEKTARHVANCRAERDILIYLRSVLHKTKAENLYPTI
jgi:hypothetical protein